MWLRRTPTSYVTIDIKRFTCACYEFAIFVGWRWSGVGVGVELSYLTDLFYNFYCGSVNFDEVKLDSSQL